MIFIESKDLRSKIILTTLSYDDLTRILNTYIILQVEKAYYSCGSNYYYVEVVDKKELNNE